MSLCSCMITYSFLQEVLILFHQPQNVVKNVCLTIFVLFIVYVAVQCGPALVGLPDCLNMNV